MQSGFLFETTIVLLFEGELFFCIRWMCAIRILGKVAQRQKNFAALHKKGNFQTKTTLLFGANAYL
jgi:hypothetical protein